MRIFGRDRLHGSVHDHAADAFALVHQLEALIDVFERHCVGDHRIDLDLALHVSVDDLRDVGAAARRQRRCPSSCGR